MIPFLIAAILKTAQGSSTRCYFNVMYATFILFVINTINTRVSGIKGLSGIHNHLILRPLLAVTKESILAYAKENKISWREDASNACACKAEDTSSSTTEVRSELALLIGQIPTELQEIFTRNL
jgi:tRNA(Ile)-lysidine synthase